jgi:hypothetical protein
VARSLPQVTKPLLKGRSRAETGLILDWPDVVGPDIAALCRPLGVAFPRPGQRDGGTLKLQVPSGHGPEVQHLVPQILQRANAYLGYRAITQVRIKQSAARAAKNREPSRHETAPAEAPPVPNKASLPAGEDTSMSPLQRALLDLAQARAREKVSKKA